MMRGRKQRKARCRRCGELAPVVRDEHGQQRFDNHPDENTRFAIPCPGIDELVAARRNRRRGTKKP